MGWLLRREVVIALAVIGGLLSVAATAFASRLGPQRTATLSRFSYAFMGLSIAVFIAIGLARHR